MAQIDPIRAQRALEAIPPEGGFEFERFATRFLAPELPTLRPIGGIHDGGRDGEIYEASGTLGTFVSASVQEDWKAKIRQSVAVLRKNGHDVRELIYCTNGDILLSALSTLGPLFSKPFPPRFPPPRDVS